MTIIWWAALIGLATAIALILFKVDAVYSLLLGTIIGALIGGASLVQTIDIIVTGSQSVMGTVIRVLAAGVLAGVMMESGAADTIARAIVSKFGDRLAILALALATMIITGVGVFIPVAVLIVAPIALEVGQRMKISKLALIVALSGGGKAGNIISPNPNTIAAAKGFNVELSQVMVADFIPAVCGLLMTVFLASLLKNKGNQVQPEDIDTKINDQQKNMPSLKTAIVTPLLAVVLLLINPLGNIFKISWMQGFQVDAMYILPIAGLVGAVAMGKKDQILMYTKAGMARMTDVVLILIGAGAIAGLIGASDLPTQVVHLVKASGISGTFLAPISGILMASATASTSTGVILAAGSFSKPILAFGVPALSAAVMVHTGATVIDHLPHGNYFHVTANAMKMTFKERMQSVIFETCVGLTMTIVAIIMYGIL